jgi:hypothetical protein
MISNDPVKASEVIPLNPQTEEDWIIEGPTSHSETKIFEDNVAMSLVKAIESLKDSFETNLKTVSESLQA